MASTSTKTLSEMSLKEVQNRNLASKIARQKGAAKGQAARAAKRAEYVAEGKKLARARAIYKHYNPDQAAA